MNPATYHLGGIARKAASCHDGYLFHCAIIRAFLLTLGHESRASGANGVHAGPEFAGASFLSFRTMVAQSPPTLAYLTIGIARRWQNVLLYPSTTRVL